MNILFLTTHINSGGITTYLKTLTRGFLERKHRVVVVSSAGDTQEDFISLGAQVKILNIKTKSELSPKIYLSLGKIEKIINEENIHIIHAHTRITQVAAHILKKRTSRAYVSTCHGFFRKRISRRLFPCWGDKVIAISEAVASHLKSDFRVSEEKIAIIPSGIPLKDFSLTSEAQKIELRKEYNLQEEPILGMVARFSEVKGQDILIKAMKKIVQEFPKTKLLLIGEGKTGQELKDLVHFYSLEDHVLFFPVVNQTAKFLSLMDVFVMPSRQEGLGISVMEAQAAGLPVVASRVGGIPSLIEQGKTGFLVETENSDQLAETVIKLLKDPYKAREIGTAARKFIEHNHSADRMIEKTLNVYERLIA